MKNIWAILSTFPPVVGVICTWKDWIFLSWIGNGQTDTILVFHCFLKTRLDTVTISKHSLILELHSPYWKQTYTIKRHLSMCIQARTLPSFVAFHSPKFSSWASQQTRCPFHSLMLRVKAARSMSHLIPLGLDPGPLEHQKVWGDRGPRSPVITRTWLIHSHFSFRQATEAWGEKSKKKKRKAAGQQMLSSANAL